MRNVFSDHLNPPSKFPNQGVLAFPGAPCEPNFRIAATENWRDGIPKARTAGGMKRKEMATKPPYNLMKDLWIMIWVDMKYGVEFWRNLV
jgi:hypothetical protein